MMRSLQSLTRVARPLAVRSFATVTPPPPAAKVEVAPRYVTLSTGKVVNLSLPIPTHPLEYDPKAIDPEDALNATEHPEYTDHIKYNKNWYASSDVDEDPKKRAARPTPDDLADERMRLALKEYYEEMEIRGVDPDSVSEAHKNYMFHLQFGREQRVPIPPPGKPVAWIAWVIALVGMTYWNTITPRFTGRDDEEE